MNFRHYILFLFVITAALPSRSFAQKALLPKYDIQSVSIGSALSSMELNKVFQDSKGFIWLGTEAGLSKFDGNKFTNFDFIDGKKIASIYDISEDAKGRIWAVGINGLIFLDSHQFKQTLFNEIVINSLLIDHDQNLIIAGTAFSPKFISNIQADSLYNGNVINAPNLVNGEQWKENFRTNSVWDLAEDDLGNIWMGVEHRLLRLQNDDLIEVWKSEQLETNISEIMAITPDSVYWGNEMTGLYFKNSKNIEMIFAPCTYSFDRTDTSLVFLTTMNLIKLEAGVYDTLSTLEGFNHLYYKDMLQDSEGNIWIATEGSLVKVTKQYFQAWTVKDSIILGSNHSITQLRSGQILIGSSKKKILEWDNHKFRLHPDIPAAHNSVTEAILEDQEGRIWYGTSMSGLILESENGMQLFGKQSGLIDKTILFIVEDEYSRIWTGGQIGISQILVDEEDVSFTNYSPIEKLEPPPRFINVLCQSLEQCWAFSRNAIFKMEGRNLVPMEIEGLEGLPIISQVVKNKQGQFLVSTLGAGILTLEITDNGKLIVLNKWDQSTGLLSNNVLNLHIDKKSRLWAFCQNGVCMLENEQTQCYDQRDGWLSLETSHVDILETADSMMWVVANSAIVAFPLYDIPNNTASPKVFITDVKLFNGRNNISKYLTPSETTHGHKLTLPYDQNFLQFNFTSTSYTRNNKNTFIYQLEGLDESWNLPTSTTFADYPGLKPGKYQFRVKAINNSGLLGESSAEYSFEILRPWYSRWWAFLIYALLFSLLGYLVYDLRISKKIKENEAKRLGELNDFQTNFYTNVTHEFRTPLTIIVGMTDQIKEKVKNTSVPIDHDLDMINRNAERLLVLINQILNLSKLQQTKPQLNYINANIIGFISQIIESLQPYAKANELSLYFYAEDEELIMDFDEQTISAILINLASNAIKYTQAKGKIIIHTKIESKGKEHFILKVKDNGKGIPETQLRHLFTRYSNSGPFHGDSMGLGLVMTKQLIDLLNGQIEVASKVGEGTEFIVSLPVHHRGSSSNRKAMPTSPNTHLRSNEHRDVTLQPHTSDRSSILLIEDNYDVANYIISCLEHKYNLLYAAQGRTGFEVAFKNIPDLIISDIMMPVMDGFEVCEKLKSNELTKHIPIILLTAKAEQKDKILGIAKGADAYLTKPFSKVEFLGRITQLLDNKGNQDGPKAKTDIASFLRSKPQDPDKIFVKNAIKFIHANLEKTIYGPPFLARNLGISESQLYKKLKSTTGKSTAIFIRSVRLEKAKEILLSTDHSISEVAKLTGFKNLSWFSRAFKNEYGFSPSEVQNR